MEIIKYIRGYSGKKFSFRVSKKDDVTFCEGGYTITPDGEFITVKRDESHSVIFLQYLSKYLGDFRDKVISDYLNMSEDNVDYASLDFFTIYGLLINLNHVLYFGLGVSDNNKNGTLFLPPNYMDVLTMDQKESCLKLFESNKFDMDISIYTWDNDLEIGIDEFLDSINKSKSI